MLEGSQSARRWLLPLGVSVGLALARPVHVPVLDSDPTFVVQRSLTIVEERELVQLIATGGAERARAQLGQKIARRPRDCAPYRLAVEAARRSGTLDALALDLGQRLRFRPEDPFLLVGYAAALEAQREHARSLNLLARAVRQQTPCATAYEQFVHSSQASGRLREAFNVLVSQAPPSGGNNAWLLYGRGLAHEAKGDNGKALAEYQRALQRARPPSEIYYRGVDLLERAGDFQRALDWAEKGAVVAEQDGPFSILARLLGQQAGLLSRLGRVDESRRVLRRATELASAEPHLLTALLLRQAYLASARGLNDQAGGFVERAQRVELDGVRDDLAARAMHELGRSYLSVSNFGAARTSFEKSLTLAHQSGDVFVLWDAQIGLAQMDLMEGFSYRALEAISPILRRSLELEDGQRQTEALETAATIYERLGSFDRALQLYRIALRRTEAQRDLSQRAVTLGNIAIVEMRLGLEAAALAHAQEAARLAPLARDRRLQTGLLQSLGATLAGAGRFAEARRVYEEALVSAEHLSAPELYGLVHAGLGRVLLALGEVEQAGRRFRDALAIGADASRLVRLQALSGLGLTEWRRGKLAEALDHFESSRELVESSRRSISTEKDRLRYQETRFTIYANLAGILTELDERYPDAGYANQAFGVVERSRARALLDVLERRGLSVSAPLLGSPTAEPTEGSQLLREEELLFEYALGEERSTLWVVSRHQLHRYALPPRRQIEREVLGYLKTVRSPPRAPSNPFEAHQDPAASLYRMLVEPAGLLLERAQHIIVAPHGVLHHLPFETLGTRDADGNFRYLIEDRVFSYVPSLSVLAGLRRRVPHRRVGGLDFVGFSQSKPELAGPLPQPVLLPIPFADDEIDAASRSFSPGRFELFKGERATEARLKRELAASHRIAHVAAHALADPSRPDRSAIFIGADELGLDDGALTMREVLSLSIGSDVVVLSGCETGLGQVMEIEGALGFTWAFLSAGASTVAVTLWNVNDRATAEVMEAFYDGVGAQASVAEALARAKRRMLRSTRRAYRHPYFWAPMIVVGLDRSLEIG